MQPIKAKSTCKTIMDLESNPSSPSRTTKTPPGPDIMAMKTPSYYRDGLEKHSENSDLYTDEDVLNCAPNGWPAIASQQMFYPNAGIHRKFSNLMQRILVNFEIELDCLDQKLLEFDVADKRLGIHGLLPFDRDEFLDRCCGVKRQRQNQCAATGQETQQAAPDRRAQQSATDQVSQLAAPIQQSHHMEYTQKNETSVIKHHGEQRTHLMNNAKSILKEYHHFISINKDFQSYPRVSRRQHLVHYQAVREELPNRAANQYLWARDDFVNTDRHTVHQWFEGILYSTWPCLQSFLAFFLCCFYKRVKVQRRTDDTEFIEYQVRVRRLGLLQKIAIASTSAVMLLTPVGLLHFYTGGGGGDGNHDKWISFGITCGSTIVFIGVITHLETNYGRALVGLCAFVAVLASFLANSSGNGAC
ncbi:hypothetical protein PG996_015835 [Apiospora saccharicola]|uniref:DUF6594 domain-containing protein n=1 Tax=Apiospora saccharicola TaxID=335842 RepID=A0ABR1TM82_9PEZI